jgi:hypothetical protein
MPKTFYVLFKKLPSYSVAGFDLTAHHSSSLLERDDTTRPHRQGESAQVSFNGKWITSCCQSLKSRVDNLILTTRADSTSLYNPKDFPSQCMQKNSNICFFVAILQCLWPHAGGHSAARFVLLFYAVSLSSLTIMGWIATAPHNVSATVS